MEQILSRTLFYHFQDNKIIAIPYFCIFNKMKRYRYLILVFSTV